jgi:hypothetical protein
MNIITPNYGTGITSCLSVRLHEACEYARKHYHWPDNIDSSLQFGLYKEDPKADITNLFIDHYHRPPSNIISSYHHEWQWNWYDDVDFWMNLSLSKWICPMSKQVKDIAEQYYNLTQGRICVLYRGNDKAKEIDPTPYDAMLEMARKTGKQEFFIQTDDEDFRKLFLFHYPLTTFVSDIPTIASNHDRYVMPQTGRALFAQKFLAALYAMRWGAGLITTTGNTGIWACFLRETLDNTYQYHGNKKMWRKVG